MISPIENMLKTTKNGTKLICNLCYSEFFLKYNPVQLVSFKLSSSLVVRYIKYEEMKIKIKICYHSMYHQWISYFSLNIYNEVFDITHKKSEERMGKKHERRKSSRWFMAIILVMHIFYFLTLCRHKKISPHISSSQFRRHHIRIKKSKLSQKNSIKF